MTEKFMSESGASVITGDNDPWTQQEQGTLTSVEDRAEKKQRKCHCYLQVAVGEGACVVVGGVTDTQEL